MFDNVPDEGEVDEQYLGGIALFVQSGGELVEDMGKQDFAYALNELCGIARINVNDEGSRASQRVLPADEVDEDEKLRASEYTSTVFERETKEWATELLQATYVEDEE